MGPSGGSVDGSTAVAELEDSVGRIVLEELEDIPVGSAAVELWSGETVTITDEFRTAIPAHGAKVFRIG